MRRRTEPPGSPARRALAALRERLTPGQQWTAGLSLALAVGVLAAGLPAERVIYRRPAPAVVAAPLPALPPASPYERTAAPAAPVAAPPPAVPASPQQPAGPAPALPGTRVAALVHPAGETTFPGRDEAAVARLFLMLNGVTAALVSLDAEASEICTRAAAADVVVAGEGLAPDLRACLERAGHAVVAYDASGGDGAQVISTARGITDSLLEIELLPGRVGVVAADALKAEVTPALARLRARGIDVVAAAYLPEGELGAISDGVRDFAARGVETVVFAVPVDQQSAWAGQQAVLTPGVRFVVADAADAIANERYPASFDGALAYTTVRGAWFARAKGESVEQRTCREAFEARVVPGAILGDDERAQVFLWCQHAALLRLLLDAAGEGLAPEDALRERTVASPVTSDLGRIAGGFGPLQSAIVRWQAACACWTQVRPFRPREVAR